MQIRKSLRDGKYCEVFSKRQDERDSAGFLRDEKYCEVFSKRQDERD